MKLGREKDREKEGETRRQRREREKSLKGKKPYSMKSELLKDCVLVF